jgi:hypothetical protein
MAADLQVTGLVVEFGNKIQQIRPNELIGCAGSPEYINIFNQHVTDSVTQEERPDYLRALNRAVDTYGEYVSDRIDNLRLDRLPNYNPRRFYPEGIFAIDNGSTRKRLFEIHTPDPCYEIPASNFWKNVQDDIRWNSNCRSRLLMPLMTGDLKIELCNEPDTICVCMILVPGIVATIIIERLVSIAGTHEHFLVD